MKRATLSLVLVLLLSFMAIAQNISVKTFQALPMDMTASSLEGKKIDQNGEVAALIKIVTTQMGFTFEGGTLGIVDTKQENGEIWVWVPHGSRKITIKHQQLGVLRDYRYPVEIESERTYEMVLVTGAVETVVKEQVTQQYLAFQVNPPNATLEVNDQIWELDKQGVAMKYVAFGDYTYRVQSPNYYTEAGKVTVNNPDDTQKVLVSLRPNFGWIVVPESGSLKGASIYIDNVFKGKAPFKSEGLKSGNHNVRIVREMYESYNTTVMVEDGQTTTVQPSLNANFAEVTLKVDANAEIWVNNEKKGIRSWTGPLENGTYRIECKMDNHENTSITQEITARMKGETIVLPAPKPIYASLNVESTPAFAKLFIDGKDMGETPKSISEILIGTHEIRLVKENFNDYTGTITVRQGERNQVKVVMNDYDAEQLAQKGIEYNKNGDFEKALECFRISAEQGNDVGQYMLGVMYGNGRGVATDDEEAMKWFQKAANQGNKDAMYSLGVRYRMGKGVPVDYGKALKWYRKAADKGHAVAYSNMAYMYCDGEGVKQDVAKAIGYFKKAAELGFDEALNSIGGIYSYGRLVPENKSEALKWHRQAAEKGNSNGQFYVGLAYRYGSGVTENKKEALKWFKKSAEQGNRFSQFQLGEMYEKGEGVSVDLTEAKKWYQLAADQGYESAQKALRRLK